MDAPPLPCVQAHATECVDDSVSVVQESAKAGGRMSPRATSAAGEAQVPEVSSEGGVVTAWSLTKLAQQAGERRKHADALRLFDDAIQLDSTNANLRLKRATALIQGFGGPRGAAGHPEMWEAPIEELRRGLELNPLCIQLHLNLLVALKMAGRTEERREHKERISMDASLAEAVDALEAWNRRS